MKITFCMPDLNLRPIGGYKIVYEYANRLQENGHEVCIAFVSKNAFITYPLPKIIRRVGAICVSQIYPRWFKLNRGIKKIAIDDISDKSIPNGDAVFATAIATAVDVANLSSKKGKKYYLIQGYENWKFSDNAVCDTYGLGMYNIVIASWLKKIVDQYSKKPSLLIKNAIDTEFYKILILPEKRMPYSIAALYHKLPCKGSQYTIEALKRLKEKYPELKAHLFGVPERPEDLPEWICYTENATKEQLLDIYNSSAIYMCTSIEEGFGLTGAESMACGCALVSTSYKGVFEYAIDKENALLSPVGNVDAIVSNVEKLFRDQNLRTTLAYQANKDIQEFSWDKAYYKLEKALLGADE